MIDKKIPTKEKVNLNILISKKNRKALEKIKKDTGRSMSHIVETFIENGIKQVVSNG